MPQENLPTIEDTLVGNEIGVYNAERPHLIDPAYRIMACIGNKRDYGEQFDSNFLKPRNSEYGITNVDWECPENSGAKAKTQGRSTYVISSIDSTLKFSEEFLRCSGIVAVGKERGTDQNISFLTHQDPKKILNDYKQYFINDLNDSLDELINRSEAGTVDVVVFGGKIYINDAGQLENKIENDNYNETVKLLSDTIYNKTGFVPVFIAGPKYNNSNSLKYDPDSDRVYFHTFTRRLYFVRPSESINESFRLKKPV